MKKVICLGLVIIFSTCLFAQDTTSHRSTFAIGKISCGAMFTIAGTATIPVSEVQPLSLWYGLAPALNVFTGKTHHHLMYGMGNNTIQTLNGYFLGKGWDAYIFYAQNLSVSSKRYLSIGIEKVFPAGDYAKFVFFGEGGTDCLGKQSISLGIVIHPQCTLWQRK